MDNWTGAQWQIRAQIAGADVFEQHSRVFGAFTHLGEF